MNELIKSRVGDLLGSKTDSIALQVPRALVVSAMAAALDAGLLVLLVSVFSIPATIAAIFCYLVGGVLQYALCSIWVFPHSPKNLAIGFTAFTILSVVGLGITVLTMKIMHDDIGMHYMGAKIIALGFTFCWNFLSRKYFLFRPEKIGSI